MKKKTFTSSKKRTILCLNRIDMLILNESEDKEFSALLAELYEECKHLYILVTSTETLGSMITTQLNPEVIHVLELKEKKSARLFLSCCGGSID